MADAKELCARLRGIYRIPITDGLGAVGAGMEPNNPDEFVRHFDTPPIHKEAATLIEQQAAEIARLTAERDNALAEKFAAHDVRMAAKAELEDVMGHYNAAQSKLRRAREALRFYQKLGETRNEAGLINDGGDNARTTLKETGDE